jgi:hypothetical protein
LTAEIDRPSRFRRILKGVGFTIGVVAMFVVILVFTFGVIPKTILGWVLLLVVGMPLAFLVEYISEVVMSDRISRKLDPAGPSNPVSLPRIAYALAVLIVGSLLVVLFVWFAGEWLSRHFWGI